MTGAPRLPDPEMHPDLTRKSLVIHWETAENIVWLDSSGLSCFDVTGLLQVAIDLAEMALPTEDYATEDSEDD